MFVLPFCSFSAVLAQAALAAVLQRAAHERKMVGLGTWRWLLSHQPLSARYTFWFT